MISDKDVEIQELHREIETLQLLTVHNEQVKENMDNVRIKLDAQIEYFEQIHNVTQKAFRVKDRKELFQLVAQGVTDIFRLEVGAVMSVDAYGKGFELVSSYNLNTKETYFPIDREWIGRVEMKKLANREAIYEEGVKGPFESLGLAYAIYVPTFDNNKRLKGLIFGGITEEEKDVYEFSPKEMSYPFVVFSQQMTGISNNMEAFEHVKTAAETKTRFFANLSHEIRTPMNAINGMIQIAARSEDFSVLRRCMEQIDISSKHLLGLLSDVLDISKIEEGKLVLACERFCLNSIVNNVVLSLKSNAENKGVTLSLNTHDMETLNIEGDAVRLSQVLINLVSNAIKFTPEGGRVDVNVKLISSDMDKALVRFSVKDTGIGISAEAQERIFSPFEQANGGVTSKFGGTGLGLSISQKIVELMNSQIELASAEGKGSEFSFTAWFDKAIEDVDLLEFDEDESQIYDFSGKRILIVDDIDINREIVAAFLEETNISIDMAENGKEALEKFENSEEGYYDVIFMDVQMPVMDGCSSTEAIRKLKRKDSSEIAIYAMTANAFKEDMQAVIDAGMNGHVAKPVDYYKIMDLLDKTFNG